MALSESEAPKKLLFDDQCLQISLSSWQVPNFQTNLSALKRMSLFGLESASQMRRSSNHGCQSSQLSLSLPDLQTEGEPFVARDPGFNLCSKNNFDAHHLEGKILERIARIATKSEILLL